MIAEPLNSEESLEAPLHNIMERLAEVRADMREEYLSEHNIPWIVGFSGGKDSTIVLQLVFEMLLELPPSKRTLTVPGAKYTVRADYLGPKLAGEDKALIKAGGIEIPRGRYGSNFVSYEVAADGESIEIRPH